MSNASIVNLGTCWGTPLGQDLSMPSYMATGFQCVAEAILRRWTTGRGELIDDPDFGYNLLDLISDDLGPADIAYAQQQAAAEAAKDERVLRATATLTFVNGVVSVNASIATAAGPFKLVASVGAETTATLLVQP